jgi:DNA-binding NarL/FixJ family response regulator
MIKNHHDGLTVVAKPEPDNPMIRILIVDDHPVFRAGIVNLLAREADLKVVGQAASGEAALTLLQRDRPDVVLLDLSMQGIDGFETLRRMQAALPDVRVIVLTSSEAADNAREARRRGARGFLTKLSDHSEIVTAIRDVCAGRMSFQEGLEPADTEFFSDPAGLTPRELEVLQLVRDGRSNAEIGQRLGITVRTVKAHMTAILEKLNVSDRAGALVRAFELRILRLPPRG